MSDGAAQVHVIGAGLAGLAAALGLSARGFSVRVYEASARAGGRCRSFFDERIGRVIDNGNHLMMSANTSVLGYLDRCGAADTLHVPTEARYAFLDLRDGARWEIRPSQGSFPWWVFAPARRVPGTRASDYLSALRLATAGRNASVRARIPAGSALAERFWDPLAIAALNARPEEGAARLLWAVLRATFAKGAAGCRPMIARESLAASLVDPAVATLGARGVALAFNARLRGFVFEESRVSGLDLTTGRVGLGPRDHIVLAVTPPVAEALLPGLIAPRGSRTIVNAHFRLDHPPPAPEAPVTILGLIGGTAEWLFVRGDVASVTVSAADALAAEDNATIERRLWVDVARALGLDASARPPARLIKERRATFAQTPAEVARRPGPVTRWPNLALAGDWTDTGLPASIEGAILSGNRAAAAIEAAVEAANTAA